MTKIFFVASLLCALMLAACATVASTPTPTPAPAKGGTIRVGFSSDADMGDVPTLMALDLLTAEGYTVQPTFFSAADIEMAALAKGDIDIGNGSLRNAWQAISKGGELRTIMEQIANDWLMVSTPDLKMCIDLTGKRLAFTNSSSSNKTMSDAYFQTNCPSVQPQIVFIANSDARAAALLAHQIDATPIEVADWIHVQNQAPDQFHIMIDFAKALPNLKATGVQVNQSFAQKNPDAVKDYLTAVLTVYRSIREHPETLKAAAIKFIKLDSTDADKVVDAYLKANLWDVNGGLTQDAVQYSIDFYAGAKSIPDGLTTDKVADLSYLNAVLATIGKK